MRTCSAAARLLAALPASPSDAQVSAVVDAITTDALSRSHPLMSVGAVLRHRGARLSPALVQRIRDAAVAALQERLRRDDTQPPVVEPAETGRWLGVREAAMRLGVDEATLRERLRDPEHRRRYGWPVWDGWRWLIADAAVDPARRAAFLLAQPAEEPQPELLPPFCRR